MARARTQLVGILNVTPDSFSDGGELATLPAVLQRASQLIDEGADMLDVGAESTRPGAMPITAEEEWLRLKDLLGPLVRLGEDFSVSISLDTRHASIAKRAIGLGISGINDVTGFNDHQMVAAVAKSDCRLVLMHSLSIPPQRDSVLPAEEDPVSLVRDFFAQRVAALEEQGIVRARLLLDPGLGFGKTAAQSLALMARWQELRLHGLPMYIGHSRKSFLGMPAEPDNRLRDQATLIASAFLMKEGVDYLRVHTIGRHATVRDSLWTTMCKS